ncbi:FMN-dependent oxidoreductase (nitrilotriacetate monooxygenase family) [Pararhizobium capsulatum DSM 1112]|uniref:FMN-dependent oxidoreductase (Nitrilotriacetate monooxygenase family) n=1 Tax=Pararhizobium capsulatum DSM 1112 TaxID=1121113 RepID=A0ABU0C2P9_9HYPH|nr:NtaA/DmoA family FMN-dependent monooxygenase [Pararhizobium capsulatum]MDQ0323377.1 FMN-dependent oxidoreductase (nitrilotriacetate monooxygenase family) [Pararhizobium capsulatum DSM 1112]
MTAIGTTGNQVHKPAENSRQMILLLFLAPVGYHTTAWRHQTSRVEDLYGLALPADIAKRAEAAKVHALFLANWLSFGETGRNPHLVGYEPFTTMGALSAVTEHIGLVGTAATTFTEPYNLARYFSQLDWLSNGRIGWNIVTATTGQENFSVTLPPRNERYAQAYEYMDVVTGLWDAWDDDAVVNDRAGGVWADRSRITPLNHEGPRYNVEGPLLIPRSPQGWPVLVQAGASDTGKDFAAKYAEVVFTVTPTFPLAQDFYRDLKARVVLNGRAEDSVKIHPGLMPIVGDDDADAQRIHDELLGLIDEAEGFGRLSAMLEGADLSGLSGDDIIPPDRLVDPIIAVREKDATTRYPYFYDLAVAKKYTIRALLGEVMKAAGHSVVVGSAVHIADHMQLWFESGAADGFAILPPTVPLGLNRFLDEVVPILQERGLFRTEYVQGTLRDNLGLERPRGRYAHQSLE